MTFHPFFSIRRSRSRTARDAGHVSEHTWPRSEICDADGRPSAATRTLDNERAQAQPELEDRCRSGLIPAGGRLDFGDRATSDGHGLYPRAQFL